MSRRVLFIIDHERGETSGISRELASCARLLAGPDGAVTAFFPGSGIAPAAERFARETGIDVLAADSPSLERYSAEGWLAALAGAVPALAPDLILASHTPRGCDFAPVLSARFGCAFISGVEGIDERDGAVLFRRTVWHGKVRETSYGDGRATVLTIMPGAFPGDVTPGPGTARITRPDIMLENTTELETVISSSENTALSGAEVVVSAGRGVGTAENMKLVEALARVFNRSAVGGSRIACDMGLVDYGAQVGLTGRTVSPRLYIACGISGSPQHIAGMKGSQVIVAINRDPDAPIFQLADLGIVDEIVNFIPAFLSETEHRRGR